MVVTYRFSGNECEVGTEYSIWTEVSEEQKETNCILRSVMVCSRWRHIEDKG